MSASSGQFSIRTLLWLMVCVAMFFLGRFSLAPRLKEERLQAQVERIRATSERNRAEAALHQEQAARKRAELAASRQNQTIDQELVTFVPDGDTLKVIHDRKETWVRLEGIDCPEKDQPFGEEARSFTHDFCFGMHVELVTEGEEDTFGRTLADVTVDGESLNLALLKNGLAWHRVQYNDNAEYASAEAEAKSNELAIWSAENPVPPWDWRKKTKSNE